MMEETGKNKSMTTILFKDAKFWIDGVEVINPELLPFYFKDLRGGLWYYTQERNHPLRNYETFTLPENLSYEIEEIPHPNPDLRDSVILGKVIRLKLKELKNEKLCPSCSLPKFGVNNTCPNTFHSLLKNETPEAVVENEKFKKALHRINDIRNSIIGYPKINWSAHIYPLVAALNEAGFEGDGYEKSRLMAKTQLDRISDLEAQLEKAKELLSDVLNTRESPKSINNEGVFYAIESFLSTNEVK